MGEPAADRWLRRRNISSGWLIPDDILIDIIIKLPVKDVLRWRCVSRKWKGLTTTVDFVRLHMRSSNPPMILVEEEDDDDVICNSKQLIDNWWEPEPKKHMFANCPEYDSQLSQDGLLVMKCKSDFVIHNPINHKQVKIIFRPETNGHLRVYGMFWHPNLKEYCIIFVVLRPEKSYHIVNLGSNPLCREIRNPWNNIIHPNMSPVLVDNYLYRTVFFLEPWPVHHSILEFDIRTEEFQLLSLPNKIGNRYGEGNTNLLNIDGELSLILVEQIGELQIWTLKDRAREMWICCNYGINPEVSPRSRPRPIAFMDGKLVIGTDVGWYVCDLKNGISNFFCKKKAYRNYHVMSLASLGNCKSEISLSIGPSPEFVERFRRGIPGRRGRRM